MKITDESVIRNGEKELIDTIIGDLDWNVIETIFREKHHLSIQDDVQYRQGDLVVHNDGIAYKLDFDVKVTLSILLDRTGNYLDFTTSGDVTQEAEASEGEIPPRENMHVEEPSSTVLDETQQAEDDSPSLQSESGLDSAHDPEKSSSSDLVDPQGTLSENPINDGKKLSETVIEECDGIEEAARQQSDDNAQVSLEESESALSPDPKKEPFKNISDMTSELSQMITEINRDNKQTSEVPEN